MGQCKGEESVGQGAAARTWLVCHSRLHSLPDRGSNVGGNLHTKSNKRIEDNYVRAVCYWCRLLERQNAAEEAEVRRLVGAMAAERGRDAVLVAQLEGKEEEMRVRS